MEHHGEVIALQIRPRAGGPAETVEKIVLNQDDGVVGDHATSSVRQVTLLAEEDWQAATGQLGVDLAWQARRANVLVRGIDLKESRKQTITIGDATVEVRGETRPCSLMDEAAPGLQDALKPDWRGGIYAAVITDGTIQVGDRVQFVKPGTG